VGKRSIVQLLLAPGYGLFPPQKKKRREKYVAIYWVCFGWPNWIGPIARSKLFLDRNWLL